MDRTHEDSTGESTNMMTFVVEELQENLEQRLLAAEWLIRARWNTYQTKSILVIIANIRHTTGLLLTDEECRHAFDTVAQKKIDQQVRILKKLTAEQEKHKQRRIATDNAQVATNQAAGLADQIGGIPEGYRYFMGLGAPQVPESLKFESRIIGQGQIKDEEPEQDLDIKNEMQDEAEIIAQIESDELFAQQLQAEFNQEQEAVAAPSDHDD
jgi:hypothetical protein